MKPAAKTAAGAGAVAIAMGFVPGLEAIKSRVYLDPIRVPTYCAGETKNPDWNRTYPRAECLTLLEGRLVEFNQGVHSCVTAPMSDPTNAAFISFAYNIGIGGFCKSSVVRLYNAGHRREACDFLLRFNRAGGIVFPGLTRRRKEERALCLEGL